MAYLGKAMYGVERRREENVNSKKSKKALKSDTRKRLMKKEESVENL